MTITPLLLVRGGWIRRNGKPRSYLYACPRRRRCAGCGAFIDCKSFANIFGPIEFPVHEPNADKRDGWDGKAFTMEEAWRIFFGTMAPWEVVEPGRVFQYIAERYAEPYNEIAENLSQYGRVTMSSLPEDVQLPIGCLQWDATDLTLGADEKLSTLAGMGPESFYRFLAQKSFLDRQNLILANTRNSLWILPDICPGSEDSLPLLCPADRFHFGEDFNGLKRLLASLPPSKTAQSSLRQVFALFF